MATFYRQCSLVQEGHRLVTWVDEAHAVLGTKLQIKERRPDPFSEEVWTVDTVSEGRRAKGERTSSNTRPPLDQVRNIGISAHVDAGKTLLTEKILGITGKSHYTRVAT